MEFTIAQATLFGFRHLNVAERQYQIGFITHTNSECMASVLVFRLALRNQSLCFIEYDILR